MVDHVKFDGEEEIESVADSNDDATSVDESDSNPEKDGTPALPSHGARARRGLMPPAPSQHDSDDDELDDGESEADEPETNYDAGCNDKTTPEPTLPSRWLSRAV